MGVGQTGLTPLGQINLTPLGQICLTPLGQICLPLPWVNRLNDVQALDLPSTLYVLFTDRSFAWQLVLVNDFQQTGLDQRIRSVAHRLHRYAHAVSECLPLRECFTASPRIIE